MRTETELVDDASEAAGSDPADAAADAPVSEPRARRHRAAGAARTRAAVMGLCWALVAAQLVGLFIWSAHLAGLSNLGWDFGIYYQPWSLIAHGHLLPRDTFQGGYLFMRNDGELIVYLLAPLYWLFPDHPLGYLWLQDLAIVAVSATCLQIVCDSLPWRLGAPRSEQAAAGATRLLVVLLVVANPWIYWTATFDIHMEVFGACFALLALRAALKGWRSTAIWAALGILCGAASALYVLGVGIAATIVMAWRGRAMLARHLGRRPATAGEVDGGAGVDGQSGRIVRRLPPRAALLRVAWPLSLTVVALVWVAGLSAAHAMVGSPSTGYAFLVGHGAGRNPSLGRVVLAVIEHPGLALSTLASHGWNLWANTSPAGLVGLLTPALFIVAPQLLANNLLQIQNFSYPSFQNFIVYGAVALGSAAVVATLLRRRRLPLRLFGAVLGLAMLVNAGGWFDAYFGITAEHWVHMSPGSSAVIETVADEAPPADEIIASQGYIGSLSGRQQVYSFGGPVTVPIRSRTVWFVLSMDQGLQQASQAETLEAIETVVKLPGVQLVDYDDNGVWVYRWHPPAGVHSLSLGQPGSPYPIWMNPGDDGVAIVSGPASSWGVASTFDPSPTSLGYLIYHDYFQLVSGRYVAEVRLQSESAVTPEVWKGGTTLITGVNGGVTAKRPETVTMPFSIPPSPPVGEYLWPSGLFSYQQIPYVPQTTVEIRVWMPNGTIARVWWVAIKPAPRS